MNKDGRSIYTWFIDGWFIVHEPITVPYVQNPRISPYLLCLSIYQLKSCRILDTIFRHTPDSPFRESGLHPNSQPQSPPSLPVLSEVFTTYNSLRTHSQPIIHSYSKTNSFSSLLVVLVSESRHPLIWVKAQWLPLLLLLRTLLPSWTCRQ